MEELQSPLRRSSSNSKALGLRQFSEGKPATYRYLLAFVVV
jgi:hypothetical protein